MDGQAASSTEITSRGISTEAYEEDGSFTSQIIIHATVENNNTEVQCWAVSDTVVLSETATFRDKHILHVIILQHIIILCRCPGSTPQPHYCGQ